MREAGLYPITICECNLPLLTPRLEVRETERCRQSADQGRWECDWHVPEEKGTYVLKSRATDTQGNSQPHQLDKRYGTYVVNHTFGIKVVVC